jgi:hypothetical protein
MDGLAVIMEIEKVLDGYDRTGEPKWEGQSDNKNKATAIFQKLRDLGALKEDEKRDVRDPKG